MSTTPLSWSWEPHPTICQTTYRDALYVIWAELTDVWEESQEDGERLAETETQIRTAASEFLDMKDYPAELDAYLSRWSEALGFK